MEYIFRIIAGLFIFVFFINPIFGVVIWTACDDENKTLAKWLDSCPKEISFLAIPIAFSLWPMAVKWRYDENK